MVTRSEIVAEALSWVGTPVRHQCGLKGTATDCKGLVVGVPRALGMPEGDSIAAGVMDYSVGFNGRALFNGLRDTLIRVQQPDLGDVLAVLWRRDPLPRHLAILTRPGWAVHAYGGGVGRVAEVPITAWRIHSSWTWPSLNKVLADG